MRPCGVVVDVQHRGRGVPHRGDRGARFVTKNGLTVWETELAAGYALKLAQLLERNGFSVLTNAVDVNALAGRYSARAARARTWGASLYLACHVNAGGGRYARTGWANVRPLAERVGVDVDAERLAVSIAGELKNVSGIHGADVHRYRALEYGGGTIRPAASRGIPAILLEPFFGDSVVTLERFASDDGQGQLARAVLEGVLEL